MGERRKPKRALCAFNCTRESFLGMSVTPADTLLRRLRGLLSCERLKSGDGLWMTPLPRIRTVSTLFPIDLICLDGMNRVTGLVENIQPFRVLPVRPDCVSFLELPLRAIHYSHTQLNDELLICTAEDMETWHRAQAQRRCLLMRYGVQEGA